MSRGRTEARNRGALKEGKIDQKEFDRRILAPNVMRLLREMRAAVTVDEHVRANNSLRGLLKQIDESTLRVWEFQAQLCEGALNAEDCADIRAMIAQVVARPLAGGSSGLAKKRYALGK